MCAVILSESQIDKSKDLRFAPCCIIHNLKSKQHLLRNREHTAPAKLRSRSPQRSPTLLAWRPVKRKPVMQHCILIGFFKTRQLFIALQHRPKVFASRNILERNTVLFPIPLRIAHCVAVQPRYLGELLFVEHWHLSLATPAPAQLHSPRAHPSPSVPLPVAICLVTFHVATSISST